MSIDDVIAAKDVISHAKVIVCQLEVPNETTLMALKVGKEGGGKEINEWLIVYIHTLIATTIFNAAPGQAGLDREFYQYTDILCVNETEVYNSLIISFIKHTIG